MVEPLSKYYRPFLPTAVKRVTFDGTPGNGAVGTVALFDVTGVVLVEAFVTHCKTTVVPGTNATLNIGVAAQPGALVELFAGATAAIVAGDFLGTGSDPTPQAAMTMVTSTSATGIAQRQKAVAADIIATIGTAALTAGVLEFYCVWRPLSPDGLLVPA